MCKRSVESVARDSNYQILLQVLVICLSVQDITCMSVLRARACLETLLKISTNSKQNWIVKETNKPENV
jgi:hypothetical protein